MEANVGFREETAVNHADSYDGKIIPLFEFGDTHDFTAILLVANSFIIVRELDALRGGCLCSSQSQ